jgi:hypothetical protein
LAVAVRLHERRQVIYTIQEIGSSGSTYVHLARRKNLRAHEAIFFSLDIKKENIFLVVIDRLFLRKYLIAPKKFVNT